MRRMFLALAGASLAAGALAAPSLSAGKSVTIGDDYFVRPAGHATVTIKTRQSLTWHWTGQHQHRLAVKSGPQRFHSTAQGHGGSYSHRFARAGIYRLYCTIHGPSMSMTVNVR